MMLQLIGTGVCMLDAVMQQRACVVSEQREAGPKVNDFVHAPFSIPPALSPLSSSSPLFSSLRCFFVD